MKANIISTSLLLAVCIYAVAAYPYSNGESEDTDLDEPLLNSRVLAALLANKRDAKSVASTLRTAANKLVGETPAADLKALLLLYFPDDPEIKATKDTDLKTIVLDMIQKKL